MRKRPILIFVTVFVILSSCVLLLAYQQYNMSKERQRRALYHELAAVKDRFRNILFNDITAANTLAIIHKEYGIGDNFDSVASQIIARSPYLERIQINENGKIINVYPKIDGYEKTIGLNTTDTLRNSERNRAIQKHGIYFAGPRKLRMGGVGILGKVPLLSGKHSNAEVVVLTSLPKIKQVLDPDSSNNRFSYLLFKEKEEGKSERFLLSSLAPINNEELIYSAIPEGDWQLAVGYNTEFNSNAYPLGLVALGVFLSAMVAFFAFRVGLEPEKLKRIIERRTRQLSDSQYELGERVKELSTIYQVNQLLQNSNNSFEDALLHIAEELPKGWQYPEICAAAICFDGEIYRSSTYADSTFKQEAPFNLIDNREGKIIVVYLKERPAAFEGPFLKEERALLNAIAETITIYFNRDIQQRKLIGSEERFRAAFEDAAIGMSIVSQQGFFMEVNAALCEMLDYSEAELLQLTVNQLTHPEDQQSGDTKIQQTLKGDIDSFSLEKRYLNRKGKIIWANLNVSIVRGEGSTPTYFVCQIENISGRVESEIKFRSLVEKSLVGIYIIQNSKFAYVNPQILTETGYEEGEIVGKAASSLFSNEYQAEFASQLSRLEGGQVETARFEIQALNSNGERIWYQFFGTSTLYGGSKAVIGTLVNITESKTVFTELAQSEANLRSIFNTTEASIILTDADLNITAVTQYMQDEYLKVNGRQMKEGINLRDALVPTKKQNVVNICNKVIASNKSDQYETSYPTPEGMRHFVVNITPISYQNKVSGICLFSFEITAQKNLTLFLEEKNTHLSELNAILKQNARQLHISNNELQQFAYVASHDLQEPLRMVTSFLSQIEKKYAPVLDDKGRQYIHFAIDGAKRMRQLILDLLEYSRAGKQEIENEQVDITALIEEITLLHSKQIEETGASIQYENLPVINGKRTPLRQVFQNLISNSLKYHKPNETPVINISHSENETHFEFTVADNGIGVEPEYFEKIFVIFQRLHNKDEYSGTGLGLAISRKIIDHLGGKIWVESGKEGGSKFIFSIPKAITNATN